MITRSGHDTGNTRFPCDDLSLLLNTLMKRLLHILGIQLLHIYGIRLLHVSGIIYLHLSVTRFVHIYGIRLLFRCFFPEWLDLSLPSSHEFIHYVFGMVFE